MAITLAQAKVGMSDKVVQQVIDEFRRNSLLLDAMTFDDAVSPGTGGSTLTYGYVRTLTPGQAQFRALNSEYTPQEAARESKTVNLKNFGGSFEIDRVIAETAGAVDEVQYQMNEKIKAASNLFHYTAINGDSAVDTNAFDGLDKALVGSDTEIGATTHIDLSDSTALDSNYKTFLDLLDSFLAELDGTPTMLMGNSKLITKLKAVARRAGYLTQAEDAFGRGVTGYDNIPLVDLGMFVNDSGIAVPTAPIVDDRTPNGEDTVTGLSDLYAVRLGIDGFHGVTVTGNKMITANPPILSGPGVVKTGDVEMVAAVALKKTRAAGVLRNIKVS